ncbi:hypothetical protein [Flavobacterium pedocola]
MSSSIGFLLIGIIAISFKLYETSRQNENLEHKLSMENAIHQNQIAELLKRYDSVSIDPATKIDPDTKEAVVSGTVKVGPVLTTTTVKKSKKSEAIVYKGLKAVNVNARGVRKISRDVLETNTSSKIDQVRVCFALEENKDIEIGKKQILVQIINPKNRSIALEGHTEARMTKQVYYDRLKTDACVFVNLYQHELIVGEYKINLIHKGLVIGSTVLKVN